MIQTGYFARARENGQTSKWTKVHLVDNGKPLCGYVPHKTMQFQWNSQGVHLAYVECDKCRENLRYHFEVTEYEQLGKTRYYAKFHESPFSISLKDVVKGYDKKFDKKEDAEKWGKHCAKLYKKFWNEVGKDDEAIQAKISEARRMHDLGGKDKVRNQAKKILTNKVRGLAAGTVNSIVDAMMEFKFPKTFVNKV